MIHAAILALALATQEGPKLEATLQDVPAAAGKKAILRCEGTTSAPEGCLITINLFYEKVETGREISYGLVPVTKGMIAYDFAVFRGKNLAGTWIAQVVFDPNLQNVQNRNLPQVEKHAKVSIGDAAQVELEKKAVRERLAGEINALLALGKEVRTQLEIAKSGTVSWAPLVEGWRKRAGEVEFRASPQQVPEYLALRLTFVANTGIEEMGHMVVASALSASKGKPKDAEEVLSRLDIAAAQHLEQLQLTRVTDSRQLAGLVEEARALLRGSVGKPPQSILPARRRFVELTQILDKSFPAEHRNSILELAGRAAAFFNAVADEKPETRELHAELDRALQKLSEAIPQPKK